MTIHDSPYDSRGYLPLPRETVQASRRKVVWCGHCYRSIDTNEAMNIWAPCPYCGSTSAKHYADPLKEK